ncbi:MAG: hypothetical protein Q7J72_04040 [Candidatus Omnitrophota bacterium]|nr:hypothetical protein [Candidatus Omnitrophota bacterium]
MEKKEKIEAGVTIIGVVALIAILAGSFGKKPDNRNASYGEPGRTTSSETSAAGPKNTSPSALQQAAAAITADSSTIGLQKERENIPWGRDPFSASKISREYQRADLELKGISFGADKSGFAFINNEIVKSGDKVGDYEVVAIEKDKILLKRGTQSFYLALPKE